MYIIQFNYIDNLWFVYKLCKIFATTLLNLYLFMDGYI